MIAGDCERLGIAAETRSGKGQGRVSITTHTHTLTDRHTPTHLQLVLEIGVPHRGGNVKVQQWRLRTSSSASPGTSTSASTGPGTTAATGTSITELVKGAWMVVNMPTSQGGVSGCQRGGW